MRDVADILSRADEAFSELDEIKGRLRLAEERLSLLCREYSLVTRTYAFQPYMLRKELDAWQGKRHT